MNDKPLVIELARQQYARQEKAGNMDIAMWVMCLLCTLYIGWHVLLWTVR